jgi:hypothetical protein
MTPVTEDKKEPKFLCTINQRAMIMCERHAREFERTLISNSIPHTIYELEDEDAEEMECQACDLKNELERPRFILPGEF